MKRVLIFIILFVAFSLSGTVYGQKSGYTVQGRVVDAESSTPLEVVNVTFNDNAFWAVTDLDGSFSITLPDGTYNYKVSYIGYETATGTVVVKGKDIKNLTIKLKESNLALSEVTITARQSTLGSNSMIDQTAIQHLQPKSVEDLLQLMPGSLTQNPSLDNAGQASVREIGGSMSNSLGTAIVLDGAPLSNDANLQMLSSAKSGLNHYSATSNSQSTTGGGIDLRSISADNIDHVEVIRGIPSAEYGNLTSGAVIIKTKQGATPLEVKAKADPNSKMGYVGKGFRLGSGTTVNLSADYSSSYADTRFLFEGFQRVTADLGVSHTFFENRPLSVNGKVSYFSNINQEKKDPQQKENERIKNEYSGFRMSLNGDWNIKTKLVSNLSYNLSASYANQYDYEKRLWQLTTGMTPVATSRVPGEFQSMFLNASYYGEHTIEGKPLNLFAQLKGSKSLIFAEDFSSHFKGGVEFKYDGNNGDGLQFDYKTPPYVRDVQTVRPRSYKDIPAMQTLSGFVENKTMMPVGSTDLTFQVGLRANRLFIDRAYLNTEDMVTFEPRLNVEWKFWESMFDHLSISGGWGLTSKMPTLAYLYPDKAYFDDASFKLADSNMDVNKSLAIMTTAVVDDTSNPDLKPATGQKVEFSLNFKKNKVNGNVTFFMEKYKDEFSFMGMPYVMAMRRMSIPAGASNPRYEGGELYYDKDGSQGLPADVRPDSSYYTYQKPANRVETDKMGVEYSLDLGRINPISTSVIIDGAWLRIKRRNMSTSWSTMGSYLSDDYPYMVQYPSGSGSLSTRLNTNIRFVTHIPKIRMIFTTTAQIVWRETSQSIYQDSKGNDLFFRATDLQRADGAESLFILPERYRDFAGNIYEWSDRFGGLSLEDMINNHGMEYRMINSVSNVDSYNKEVYPGYVIFNFRLTKEFGDRMSLSFMANNMFNTRKTHKNVTSQGISLLTIPMYFGAELKLKI